MIILPRWKRNVVNLFRIFRRDVFGQFNRPVRSVFEGGTGKIRRTQDVAGRISTLTVDGCGDLVTVTTPELCQTSLRYDGLRRLTAVIDPESRLAT